MSRQIIAQMPVFSVILLHEEHMTKAGAAIAMTEIIQFGEIQFFYMILYSISGSHRNRTNKTSTSMYLQCNYVQKQMKHITKDNKNSKTTGWIKHAERRVLSCAASFYAAKRGVYSQRAVLSSFAYNMRIFKDTRGI